MKNLTLLVLVAVLTMLTACGSPAGNAPANSANSANANSSKPVAAAPTKDAIMAIETKAWEAWKAHDGKYFEDMLTDNTIGMDEKGRTDKAAIVKLIADPGCVVKSYSLSDDQMTALGPDAALITYKAAQDVECGGHAVPAVIWAASVFIRSGDKWKAAYHNEMTVPDPKAEPAKPSVSKPATEAKPQTDTKPADAATDALLAVEKKGWEAWKARDPKAIEGILSKDLLVLDGGARYDYAGTMKLWFETKCDIKSYSLTQPSSVAFTKDMSILIFKTATDGTCEGQKIQSAWDSSIYVKDGENWKLTFGMANPL
jgi:hypothetical protein